MKHTPAFCSVRDCKDEAEYYIDASGLTQIGPSTFYLCPAHMKTVLSDETGDYHHIHFGTGEISDHEICGYSCHDGCGVCNPLSPEEIQNDEEDRQQYGI